MIRSTSLERLALQSLREEYEGKGFEFLVAPSASLLPLSARAFPPDAIAIKDNERIAFEVKVGRTGRYRNLLAHMAEVYRSEPNWDFILVNVPNTAAIENISRPDLKTIRSKLQQASSMSVEGYNDGALLIAWSCLDAAVRTIRPDEPRSSRTSGSIATLLYEDGLVDPDDNIIRRLSSVRNLIAHGDFSVSIHQKDVQHLITLVKKLLDRVNAPS